MASAILLRRLRGVAVVDDEDFPALAGHEWGLSACGVYTHAGGRTVLMHRAVMGEPDGLVDHIDGNHLDNRKENLRVCSHAQNMRNRKRHRHSRWRYKGVSFEDGRWRARIRVGGRRVNLGSFATEEEAARAYDMGAMLHHGRFARLNFPGQ